MNFKQRPLVGFLTGLMMLSAISCSNQTAENPSAESETANSANPTEAGEINLYSSRHYDTDDALYDNFTKQTGIKVNLIEGKASELIEKIKSEGENSPADVLITVDVGNLWRATQEGLLQPVESQALESSIPDNLQSPNNDWFGLSKRARIIVYNTDKVKPEELSTYEDLANSKWKGRICIRSSSNVYNQSLIASKIEELQEEQAEAWVKGVVSNFAREPEGNDTAQIKAVAAGECDVALVNHYYVARLQQSQEAEAQEIVAKIGAFFPNQNEGGTHINISGGGVVSTSPNPEQAIKFMEYLVTPEAQAIFADGNNEFPIVSGIKVNDTVEALGEFKESELSISSYGEKNADAVKVMDRSGWK